ncbi:hypothetical protein KCP75_24960 [Salmonella enterica subsp. enterica]|nr:hypothetical protein KCP75_24960 [Salmonella enterica subsp. enterica]
MRWAASACERFVAKAPAGCLGIGCWVYTRGGQAEHLPHYALYRQERIPDGGTSLAATRVAGVL